MIPTNKPNTVVQGANVPETAVTPATNTPAGTIAAALQAEAKANPSEAVGVGAIGNEVAPKNAIFDSNDNTAVVEHKVDAAALYQQRLAEQDSYQAARLAISTPTANTTEGFSNESTKNGKTSKSYQFPSAPTSYQFPWRNSKITIPDGIYTTSDPQEIADLDASVEAGNIYPFSQNLNYSENPFLVPSPPLRADKLN